MQNFLRIDSVLTWVDVSDCAKKDAAPQGQEILEGQWNAASRKFNTAMEAKDKATSFKMLEQANKAFLAVAPYIKDPALKKFFLDTNKQFGAKLATKDMAAINKYMQGRHTPFINAVKAAAAKATAA